MRQVQTTYEEDYYAETQYVDNDSWYTTQTQVLQEEVAGHHEVTMLTTYEERCADGSGNDRRKCHGGSSAEDC